MPYIKQPTQDALDLAAKYLEQGRLVAFPTETVYGLGGNACLDRAIAAIYAAKNRPQFNPLIAHVDSPSKLDHLIVWNEAARKLADAFWPGPLTMVLPRADNCAVSLLASAGLNNLAVRIPDHPVALALLALVSFPIVAPSANASGKLSPTCAAHVAESLQDNVDLILDGGATRIGVESTVIDLTTATPTILRHGGITQEALEGVLGPVSVADHNDTAPHSPGQLRSHYAPDLPVRLNAAQAADDEAFLLFGDEAKLPGGALRLNLSPSGDLREAAANLFAFLRQLDAAHLRQIAVAPIPMTGLGVAIQDRLDRAAAPRPSASKAEER